MGKKNWIKNAVKKPGALRKTLGVKEGQNIPASKLNSAIAKGSKPGATASQKTTAKRAQLAKTFKKMKK